MQIRCDRALGFALRRIEGWKQGSISCYRHICDVALPLSKRHNLTKGAMGMWPNFLFTGLPASQAWNALMTSIK